MVSILQKTVVLSALQSCSFPHSTGDYSMQYITVFAKYCIISYCIISYWVTDVCDWVTDVLWKQLIMQ